MQPGINYDSHGLRVAELAGMPPAAMKVAEETLSRITNDGGRMHNNNNGQ